MTYNLNNGIFLDKLQSVDNVFIRQIYNLALTSAQQGKTLGVIPANFIKNSNAEVKKILNEMNSNVLNICNLTPLEGKGYDTLVDEIADVRAEQLGFAKTEVAKNSTTLFLDYLLNVSLCYVEVFGNDTQGKSSSKVDKFFATRNPELLQRMLGVSSDKMGKYENYLRPVLVDYQIDSLRVIKLSRVKDGYKATQPRKSLDLSRSVKVTPMFFINTFVDSIIPILNYNMVKFTYIKDGGQLRTLTTTLSRDIFTKYYTEGYSAKVLAGFDCKLDRGYIKVPELGLSKYDDSGLRALNITRLVSMEIVTEIDTQYIDVDFNSILPTFKQTVDNIDDMVKLGDIYKKVVELNSNGKTEVELKTELNTYVDTQYIIGTTTFLQTLHSLMLGMPEYFAMYDGKPKQFEYKDTFSLGVVLG